MVYIWYAYICLSYEKVRYLSYPGQQRNVDLALAALLSTLLPGTSQITSCWYDVYQLAIVRSEIPAYDTRMH